MNASERDNLLIEIKTSQKLLFNQNFEDHKEMKNHLAGINGHLDDHSTRITITETLQKERNKPNKKTTAGYITGGVGLIAALWKAFFG